MTLMIPVPKPSYSQARETLVKVIPPKVICLLACGGRDCRYETPVCWRPNQQAIKGLFSSWVTDDIVAMARPSTSLIKAYDIINQFKKISASEAVHYVRIKRPCSIQTRAQINMVFDFSRLLGSQLAQYPMLTTRHCAQFTMTQYLQRQAMLLHGEEARFYKHTPKILHFICTLLTALAQEASIPPEVWQELEKKAAILVLQRAVRNVLVLQRYLPVQVDESDSFESVSSWDEPFGFLERKREILMYKRSFSESDLSKISLNKDIKLGHTGEDKLSNGIISHLRKEELITPAFGILINETNSAADGQTHISSLNHRLGKSDAVRRVKYTMGTSAGFAKFTSNIELCKNNKYRKPSVVAQAMAQKEPTGSKVLQRATLLQKELNSSAYGWATLATETNPKVLSALMWIWLENLKVTSPCPHLETPILQKLIQALTRNLTEDTESYDTLLKVLKSKIRDLQRVSCFNMAARVSAIRKIPEKTCCKQMDQE
ncbi:Protein tyrosine phosphatase domain-containing protein 1 [Bagarius yarrelli]|uniref:Protein tyrosine phosphatase domain-containing protein 1 n=1 Tax=Bagarius yarrelli TaxID=175774 RepID=A0A556TQH9_BAGYA|nr:Protein tyrosine phosphatase domain-containing protein 1 [Bagarius yarrelli]